MKYRDRFKTGAFWGLFLFALADTLFPFFSVTSVLLLVAVFWPRLSRRIVRNLQAVEGSSNGRTPGFGPGDVGSNPAPSAIERI